MNPARPGKIPPGLPAASSVREPGAEPLPGYRLIEPLGRGGFGEVWKCEAPGGILKAIKFIKGQIDSATIGHQAAQEYHALKKVVGIRHPFLLSMDRIEEVNDELLIVMELADRTLFDLFEAYRQAGYAGIPRDELIGYISEAAEALDLMNTQYNLQHLDIKPGNLFLVANHVKVADFGLVGDLGNVSKSDEEEGGDVHAPVGITPLYVSPEVLQGKASPNSDQYSLAIVYQELLTGTLPFVGKNSRSLAMQHLMAEPTVDAVPVKDAPIVIKALSKEPSKRFPSCLAFVQALLTGELTAQTPQTRIITPAAAASRILKAMPVEPKVEAVGLNQADKTGAVGRTTESFTESPRNTTVTSPAALLGGKDDLLAGFQYLDLVGRSPLGETWKVKDAKQNKKLAKIVTGFESTNPKEEARNISVLASIKHPGLLKCEVTADGSGRVALISEVMENSVWEQFQSYRSQRLQGVPRSELLGYLREAAETLDDLSARLNLYHLALTPRAILLPDNDAAVLADFGLVQLLWLPAGHALVGLNPRYGAAELADNAPCQQSDVYSLALIFAEMLTGVHPFKKLLGSRGGASGRGRASSRLMQPELDTLPASDRALVAQALHPDPGQRFHTCVEFIELLEQQGAPREDARRGPTSPSQLEMPSATWFDLPQEQPSDAQKVAQAVGAIVESIAAQWPIEVISGIRFFHRPGEVIVHRCGAMLPPGIATAKLEGFCQACGATPVRSTENEYVYHLHKPPSFWQKMRSIQPGLEVTLRFLRPASKAAMLTEVTVLIAPFGAEKEEATELLRGVGPKILEQVRTYLQATPERHANERYDYAIPIQVQPVFPRGELGAAIECQGKDISVGGIALYSPLELPTPQFIVHLMNPATGEITPAPACVLRSSACREGGWIEIGARFLLDGTAP
jgi:serine/threonine protein kinase